MQTSAVFSFSCISLSGWSAVTNNVGLSGISVARGGRNPDRRLCQRVRLWENEASVGFELPTTTAPAIHSPTPDHTKKKPPSLTQPNQTELPPWEHSIIHFRYIQILQFINTLQFTYGDIFWSSLLLLFFIIVTGSQWSWSWSSLSPAHQHPHYDETDRSGEHDRIKTLPPCFVQRDMLSFSSSWSSWSSWSSSWSLLKTFFFIIIFITPSLSSCFTQCNVEKPHIVLFQEQVKVFCSIKCFV